MTDKLLLQRTSEVNGTNQSLQQKKEENYQRAIVYLIFDDTVMYNCLQFYFHVEIFFFFELVYNCSREAASEGPTVLYNRFCSLSNNYK